MNISKRHEQVRKLYTFFVCQGKTTQEINDLYLIRFSLQHKIMLITSMGEHLYNK